MYTSTSYRYTHRATLKNRIPQLKLELLHGAANQARGILLGTAATAVLLWVWNFLSPAHLANAYAGWMGTLAIALAGAAWTQMWSVRSGVALVTSGIAFAAAVLGIESFSWLIGANVALVVAALLLHAQDSEDLISSLRWHAIVLALIAPWLVG